MSKKLFYILITVHSTGVKTVVSGRFIRLDEQIKESKFANSSFGVLVHVKRLKGYICSRSILVLKISAWFPGKYSLHHVSIS